MAVPPPPPPGVGSRFRIVTKICSSKRLSNNKKGAYSGPFGIAAVFSNRATIEIPAGRPIPIGSATFEQLLAFGATFCGFSNLEQVLPFRAIFEQNIGLEHISSTKKSTISWKTSIHANFLKAYHVINLLNT